MKLFTDTEVKDIPTTWHNSPDHKCYIKQLAKKYGCYEETVSSIIQTVNVSNMLPSATGCAPEKSINKKILPRCFKEVVSGIKTFELTKDEDDIQQGDTLYLLEWDQVYTGRGIECKVTYVLRNCSEYGLMDGYCIIGIDAVRLCVVDH